jgi:hypothetical protein
MNMQLFEGERVRLTPHDPEYLRRLSADPACPLSPGQIKKKYEEAGKEKNPTIRTTQHETTGDMP